MALRQNLLHDFRKRKGDHRRRNHGTVKGRPQTVEADGIGPDHLFQEAGIFYELKNGSAGGIRAPMLKKKVPFDVIVSQDVKKTGHTIFSYHNRYHNRSLCPVLSCFCHQTAPLFSSKKESSVILSASSSPITGSQPKSFRAFSMFRFLE